MKTIKKSVIFIIGSIFAAVSFTACTANDDNIVLTPSTPGSDYSVSDVKVIRSGFVKTEINPAQANVNELKP